MEGLRAKWINDNPSTYTLVVMWNLPNSIPDNYSIDYHLFDHEEEATTIYLSGVSFLYIMEIIIKTN